MMDIERLKLPGAQRSAGVQTPEIKIKVIELRIGSHMRSPRNLAIVWWVVICGVLPLDII
jgi:hypothetical protein